MMKYVTRVLLMAASSSVVLAITPHRIINLGTLPEDDRSSAYGISADGTTVVGWSIASGGGRTFRWTDTDGMTVTGINSITGNYPPPSLSTAQS
jgi:probable HAF family extracellular repeat protein